MPSPIPAPGAEARDTFPAHPLVGQELSPKQTLVPVLASKSEARAAEHTSSGCACAPREAGCHTSRAEE
jgi:hypothetical protein